MIKRALFSLLFVIFSFAKGLNAIAYTSFMDDAEVMEPGVSRAYGATQLVLSGQQGLNLTSHIETGLSESTTFRAMLGFGQTDFHVGGAFKWVPIPDIDSQPGIGVRTSLLVGSQGGESVVSAFLTPFLSKKISSEAGKFTVFAGFPFGLQTVQNVGSRPTSMVFGTEWETQKRSDLRVGSEINVNFSDSFYYLSLFGVFYFDDGFVSL